MQIFKKYQKEIIAGFVLIGLYLITRLFNLLLVPLFTDEAIYLRWSQIAKNDASWRFISLTDGKQPLFVWLTMTMMKVISNPLLAGRLVSVGAGFLTIGGLFFLARELFKSKRIAFFSAFLYLFFPMALVYDKMALYDGLVGTFSIWSLYLAVVLVRSLRLDVALVLAMVIGGGLLTKTSSFFSLYLLPLTLILFDWQQKERKKRLMRWGFLAILVLVQSYAYYSILRLSPFFHIINDKNSVFVYPIKEWLEHPWRFFWGNFLGLWDWLTNYMSWPMVLLIVLSFFSSLKHLKEKVLLFVWFGCPFLALALFGKVLYPRFIFFMLLFLLPLAAFSLEKIWLMIKNKKIVILTYFVLSVLWLRTDYFLLTKPEIAPIPKSDLSQYLNGWPAGGGIKETIEYLNNQAIKQQIYVASEGTFGSLPTWAVEIYLGENKNIDKRGIWPLPKDFPEDLRAKAVLMPTFFIFNQTQTPPRNWPLKLISRYQKGIGDSYLSLYQVIIRNNE